VNPAVTQRVCGEVGAWHTSRCRLSTPSIEQSSADAPSHAVGSNTNRAQQGAAFTAVNFATVGEPAKEPRRNSWSPKRCSSTGRCESDRTAFHKSAKEASGLDRADYGSQQTTIAAFGNQGNTRWIRDEPGVDLPQQPRSQTCEEEAWECLDVNVCQFSHVATHSRSDTVIIEHD